MITGYRIPGSSRGRALTLPDFCFGFVAEEDAQRIADRLRQKNWKEPTWQSVRAALIRLAKQRGGSI